MELHGTQEHGTCENYFTWPDLAGNGQVVRVVRALRACSVFVATDRDAMLDRRNRVLELPAGLANHFVGNCVSSFSAFVKRHRDVNGPAVFLSSFWAFQPLAGDGGHECQTFHSPVTGVHANSLIRDCGIRRSLTMCGRITMIDELFYCEHHHMDTMGKESAA
ncbi:hypothetical protein MRX96_013715 [Rhipicephalus microplus]